MTMTALKKQDDVADSFANQLENCKNHLVFVNGVPSQKYSNHAAGSTLIVDGSCCSIKIGAGSELNFLEIFTEVDGRSYSMVTDVHVAAGASLRYTKIQAQSLDSQHTATTRICLDEKALLHSVVLTCGGKFSHDDLQVKLEGRHAEVSLYGLYAVRGAQVVNHHTTVHHNCAETTSRQIYKGILNGKSRAVFKGRVTVAPKAQHIDAAQLNKNLLLSKEAQVDTKPELEIAANDVSCTHGATVGQISEEELFYLQTRAIDRDQAQKILVHAFADDIVEHVKDAGVRNLMAKALELNFWNI